jgi:hypothetical protein
MTLTTFRVIVAETSTAIDADRISRKMTYRPTSHRRNRSKQAWTELSKEAVWLAIVDSSAVFHGGGDARRPESVAADFLGQADGLGRAFQHVEGVPAAKRLVYLGVLALVATRASNCDSQRRRMPYAQ